MWLVGKTTLFRCLKQRKQTRMGDDPKGATAESFSGLCLKCGRGKLIPAETDPTPFTDAYKRLQLLTHSDHHCL